MLVIDDSCQRGIEVVEMSASMAFESDHLFTAEEVVMILQSYKDNTFQCPICKRIVFPDVGINQADELYVTHGHVFAHHITGVTEFMPDRACINCASAYKKQAKSLNAILEKQR